MSAQRLHVALTEETQQLETVLPTDSIGAELARVSLEVPAAVGAVMTRAAFETEVSQGEFIPRVETFMDPEEVIDIDEQLAVMHEFWSRLGYEVPELTVEQMDKLTEVLCDEYDKRVMPTPLLTLQQRQDIAERARIFSGHQLNPDIDALWVPDESSQSGQLIRNDQLTEETRGASYAMRYKTADGEIVDREEYVASLIETGEAVEAEDGTVWTYPVMDVRVNSNRKNKSPKDLYKQVDPLATPESLIAMQLLHQAAGLPNAAYAVDFANEAIYRLNDKGNPATQLLVAGVHWEAGDRQVTLDYWSAEFRNDHFGVRTMVSGL